MEQVASNLLAIKVRARDGFNYVGALGLGCCGGPFRSAEFKKISDPLFSDFSANFRRLSNEINSIIVTLNVRMWKQPLTG